MWWVRIKHCGTDWCAIWAIYDLGSLYSVGGGRFWGWLEKVFGPWWPSCGPSVFRPLKQWSSGIKPWPQHCPQLNTPLGPPAALADQWSYALMWSVGSLVCQKQEAQKQDVFGKSSRECEISPSIGYSRWIAMMDSIWKLYQHRMFKRKKRKHLEE